MEEWPDMCKTDCIEFKEKLISFSENVLWNNQIEFSKLEPTHKGRNFFITVDKKVIHIEQFQIIRILCIVVFQPI